MEWSASYAFARIQEAFQGLNQNIRVPVIGAMLRGPIAYLRAKKEIRAEAEGLLEQVGLQDRSRHRPAELDSTGGALLCHLNPPSGPSWRRPD